MTCPPEQQLRDLLADCLPDKEAEIVEAHVEGCAPCQRALERLIGPMDFQGDSPLSSREGSTLLSKAPEAARGPEFAKTFLHRLEKTPPPIHYSFQSLAEAGSAHYSGETVTIWPEIAGYRIIRELGRGGMGVVYLAWQTKLNRQVALKMILAGAHAGREQLDRFRLEAEAVAQLQHPTSCRFMKWVSRTAGLFFRSSTSMALACPTNLPARRSPRMRLPG
jgi:hypothetical protein